MLIWFFGRLVRWNNLLVCPVVVNLPQLSVALPQFFAGLKRTWQLNIRPTVGCRGDIPLPRIKWGWILVRSPWRWDPRCPFATRCRGFVSVPVWQPAPWHFWGVGWFPVIAAGVLCVGVVGWVVGLGFLWNNPDVAFVVPHLFVAFFPISPGRASVRCGGLLSFFYRCCRRRRSSLFSLAA